MYIEGTSTLTTYYYAGGSYEVQTDGTTETMRQYYAIAGKTVAMREGTAISYFLTDHLGSMVGVTDASGTLISETRYLPFGEVRLSVGSITQTDFGYTFQRNLPELGLMDYKARFYNSSLGRFMQPDTIVPGAGNPQAYNRFVYSNNNPINYTDPSGHKACTEFDNNGNCVTDPDSKYGIAKARVEKNLDLSNESNGSSNPMLDDPLVNIQFTCGSFITALEGATCNNFNQALGISSNINAHPTDRFWSSYYVVTVMNLHFAIAVGLVVAGGAYIVPGLATYFTMNPNSVNVSLGSYANGNGYTQVGENYAMTYLQAPSWTYNLLNTLRLWNPINEKFISMQMDLGKTFFVGSLGPGTQKELIQIMNSGAYKAIDSIWSSFGKILYK